MLTRRQAEDLLDEALVSRSELSELECKSGAGNALQHALCAAANRRDRNGGVVVVGVDDDFNVAGVEDAASVQKLVADWSSQLYNVQLRVDVELLERKGLPLLAVIVPPCPSGSRPCFLRRDGPYDGAWIRVGNTTRKMTQDEVRREIAADEVARGAVPAFDMSPVESADRKMLDDKLTAEYVAMVLKARPGSQVGRMSLDEVLRSVNAVAQVRGEWHPTPAGLLFFCPEPQKYLPQSSVEFLHLWGPELTSLGPDGSRWRANREFTGTLPQIIVAVEAALLERIATRGIINRFRRHDEPEYPRFALREAIVNAVAHRDYTLRGSRIQVRLFPDRVEVQTPGGLPPPVTVDNIEDEQAARNEAIVTLLQDYDYMERRGYGFNGLVAEMRKAGLAPPQMWDDGASFNLVLKSHVLMSPEGLEWLKQFSSVDLTPQERLALAYLRVNEKLYNRDYARLADVTGPEATQALRRMVERELLTMKGTRGGAYYVLAGKRPPPGLFSGPAGDDERILALARQRGRIARRDVVTELGLNGKTASVVLRRLLRQGKLQKHGARGGVTYSV
jgi:ATP-dependent DNA helicase RecG